VPSIAFELRDYSTRARLRPAAEGRGSVFVPRRFETAPALGEQPYSSWRESDPRNYFPTRINGVGDVVVPDVPVGTYRAEFRLPAYVERELGGVASPAPFPIPVLLHRSPTYSFAREDTRVFGSIRVQDGRAPTRFEVVLQDPEAGVPSHRVPVTADSEFVVYAPEKRTSNVVTLRLDCDGVSTGIIESLAVTVHRANSAPAIVVP
jgi:hypothetical protein